MEKKGGGQRPVINLKGLNSFIKAEHFKMEGRSPSASRPNPGSGLDGEARTKGCLPSGPNSPRQPMSPPIPVGEHPLLVSLSW